MNPPEAVRKPRRIALVSCVKSKKSSSAAAQDLYVSPLFHGLRRFAESKADAWYILSAEHGLLSPDEIVAPYEKTLNKMPRAERLAWAEKVRQQLLEVLPTGAEIILLAGARYRHDIEAFLRSRGYAVSVPLEGFKMGQQLQYLKSL